MGRAFSSVCMAFCGIVGVLILFNVCVRAPGVLSRAAKTGAYDAAFWAIVAAELIGAVIAIGLIAVAFLIRRHLKALDAKIEEAEMDSHVKSL